MRVVGIGSCSLQHIGVVERIPEPDFPREFNQFSSQGSGTSSTALVVLSRWGVQTSVIGKVADDWRGDQIRETLTGDGVEAQNLVVQPDKVSPLRFSVVESSTDRRQLFYTLGNVDPLLVAEVSIDMLEGADLLICDGTHLEAEIVMMRHAREASIPVVLDASRTHPKIHETVALADVLIASERFASQFTGVGTLQNMCETMLERGPKTVVVTLGHEGSAGMNADRTLVRQPALEIPKLDVTGAGDVYLAGFCFGTLQKWDLGRKMVFANAAAGKSCQGLGSRSVVPSLEEIS